METSARIPSTVRPQAYAGVELLLNLLHVLREATGLDYETIVIACVINEAAMRPLLLGKETPATAKDLLRPPAEYRGSISRVAVAEITGIPRETVRRKINFLIGHGMVEESERGRVRPATQLDSPIWQKVATDGVAAVRRFDKRLAELEG